MGIVNRRYARWVGTGVSGLLLLGSLLISQVRQESSQPIEYPHNRHIALGLECLDCHSFADTQARATIPSIQKCMLCHEKYATDLPGVQALAKYYEKGREAPWRRVYGFPESAAVRFRHAPHVRANVACTTCHGNVAEMTVAVKAVNHTMGTCVSCHRQSGASDDCVTCHY